MADDRGADGEHRLDDLDRQGHLRRPLDPQSTLFQNRDAVGVEGGQIEIVQDGEDADPPLARPWRR